MSITLWICLLMVMRGMFTCFWTRAINCKITKYVKRYFKTIYLDQRKMSQGVQLGVQNKNNIVLVKFTDCIVDFFNKEALGIDLYYTLQDGIFVLSDAPWENKTRKTDNRWEPVRLEHAFLCPIRNTELADYQEAGIPTDRNVAVAVSVVVESSDQCILLTRRAEHMRSSPKSWVPPGGHLEKEETLIEGGFREVKEETGLDLTKYKTDTKILCLWENVYPVLLGLGTPRSHVLTVYLHTTVQATHQELLTTMMLDPTEVSSYSWLNYEDVRTLVHGTRNGSHVTSKQFVLKNNVMQEEELQLNSMFMNALWFGGNFFSGSQCIIVKWFLIKSGKSKF